MKLSTSLKFGAIASLMLVAILGVNGCKKTLGENKEINASLEGAPAWVLESNDDLLSAVGSAKIKDNNLNFASVQAGMAARAEIAAQISIRIESAYKELSTNIGDSANQEAVLAIRNSVDQALVGSKTTKKWVSKDGTLWVLVQIKTLDTSLLKNNLLNFKHLDKAAATELSKTVDDIIDRK